MLSDICLWRSLATLLCPLHAWRFVDEGPLQEVTLVNPQRMRVRVTVVILHVCHLLALKRQDCFDV